MSDRHRVATEEYPQATERQRAWPHRRDPAGAELPRPSHRLVALHDVVETLRLLDDTGDRARSSETAPVRKRLERNPVRECERFTDPLDAPARSVERGAKDLEREGMVE